MIRKVARQNEERVRSILFHLTLIALVVVSAVLTAKLRVIFSDSNSIFGHKKEFLSANLRGTPVRYDETSNTIATQIRSYITSGEKSFGTEKKLIDISWRIVETDSSFTEILQVLGECLSYEKRNGHLCSNLVKAIAAADKNLGEEAAIYLLDKNKKTQSSPLSMASVCSLVADVMVSEESLEALKKIGSVCNKAKSRAELALDWDNNSSNRLRSNGNVAANDR
jgi:hypothetical protein